MRGNDKLVPDGPSLAVQTGCRSSTAGAGKMPQSHGTHPVQDLLKPIHDWYKVLPQRFCLFRGRHSRGAADELGNAQDSNGQLVPQSCSRTRQGLTAPLAGSTVLTQRALLVVASRQLAISSDNY